jgi:hypothetical protein
MNGPPRGARELVPPRAVELAKRNPSASPEVSGSARSPRLIPVVRSHAHRLRRHLAIHSHSILAFAFGGIHGNVGTPQQLIAAVGASLRNSGADGAPS